MSIPNLRLLVCHNSYVFVPLGPLALGSMYQFSLVPHQGKKIYYEVGGEDNVVKIKDSKGMDERLYRKHTSFIVVPGTLSHHFILLNG